MNTEIISIFSSRKLQVCNS